MKILSEIIDGAASADVALSVLLRKSLVLASRLKNETLKKWCSAELDGYDGANQVPEYRVFPCQSLGLLLSPFQTIDRQPIPLSILEKRHRDIIRDVVIRSGIAEMEAMVAGGAGEDTLTSPWAPDMTALYQLRIIDGYSLNRAWREFPKARLVGICDTVRNRLLRFALELHEEVGDSDTPLQQMTPAQVEAKVVNYIYGGQNVIGTTIGRDLSQVSIASVVKGDFASLAQALQRQGIQPEDIKELPAAIAADDLATARGELGSNIQTWLGRAAKGVASGAKSIGVQTAAAAIKHYLGI